MIFDEPTGSLNDQVVSLVDDLRDRAQWPNDVGTLEIRGGRPSQVSERLIVIFAESGNWHSACAEEPALSFRRLRLRHSDPWNVMDRCHRPTCTSVHDGAIVSQHFPRGTQLFFFYATTTFETHLELQLCRYLPSCPDTFPKTFSASFHHNNTLVEPNTFDHEPVTLRSFNAAAT